MYSQQIKFTKELSKNNLSSTHEAEIDGVRCIVKCVMISNASTLDIEKIKRNLDAQIKFSAALDNEEYQKNIALFTKSCGHENKLCYFRPYVDGVSLAEKIKESNCLSSDEASQIILKIARILAYAHQHGITHGDLKPENIIISDDDSISIIDWETMKLNKEAQDLYADGRTLKPEDLIGTPHYMAPEQCNGDVSEQADVYALGMIYYKMLTGETPFDHCEILKIYEAKHRDIDDTVFHDKKINADITQIIGSALKVDLNNRTPSASQFVKEIENYLNITSSAKEVHPVESNGGEVIPHDRGSTAREEYKLVLIGHPGAGKTVLATGLYAMSDEKFSVEGASSETIKFMDGVKTILQRGEWPEPTAKSKVKKLDFKVFYNNHQDCISFDEYAGENVLSTNYFKDFFDPCPAGAIILLNPSFIVAVDDLTRNKQIASLKNCISYLSEQENPPAIAFVITAADRLKTDLKDKASEFEKYKKEIRNSLKAHKMNFKIFAVSVTGEIENNTENEKAALNPAEKGYEVKKPFIWILKQIHQSKQFSIFKKVIRWSCIALILLAVIATGRWCWEWHDNNELLNRFTKLNAIHSGKDKVDDLDKYIKNLAIFRAELCLKKHILTENNAGSQVAECNSQCMKWTQRCLFPDRRRALENTILRIEEKIDEVKSRLLLRKYDDLQRVVGKGAFKDECSYLISDFKEWVPLSAKGMELKEIFKKEKYDTLPAVKERHQFAVVDEKLRKVVSEKNSEYPIALDSDINQLPTEAKTHLLKEEWKQLKKQIDEHRLAAHQSVERVQFSNIEQLITSVINDANCKVFPADIDTQIQHLPHKSSLSFQERKSLDENLKRLCNQARKSVATRISEDVKNILHSVIKNSGDEIPAEYTKKYQEWRDAMGYFVEPKEAEEIDKEILGLLQKAHEKVFIHLCNKMQGDIDSFKGNTGELADLIRRYNVFFKTNSYNVKDASFQNQKNISFVKLRNRLEGYIKDQCSQFDKEQMSEKCECPPEFKDDIEKNILPLVPEIKAELQNLLNSKLQETSNKWKAERLRVVNAFISTHRDSTALEILTGNYGLKDLCRPDNEYSNPYLRDVEKFFINRLNSEINDFIDKIGKRNFSDDDFLYMKKLGAISKNKMSGVGAIIDRNCPNIKSSKKWQWLEKYFEWKNTNTSFRMVMGDLSVCVSYLAPDKPYFNEFYCKIGGQTLTSYHSSGWNTTRFKNDVYISFNDSEYWPPAARDVTVNQKWVFYAKIKDCKGAGDRNIAEVYSSFYPGVDDIDSPIEASGDNGVIVRINFDLNGIPFLRWLKSNPVPEAR